jgi:hypothetical protein
VKKAKANMEICKYAVSDLIVSREFSAANGNDRCFSSGKKEARELVGWREDKVFFSVSPRLPRLKANEKCFPPLQSLNPIEQLLALEGRKKFKG